MLDTALALDDKDPRLSDGVGNRLCPDSSIEDVPRFKEGAVLYTSTSIAHLDAAIEDRKDLLSIIDMPLVWLIRPMKARGDPAHIGNTVAPHGRSALKVLPRNTCMQCLTPELSRAAKRRGLGRIVSR